MFELSSIQKSIDAIGLGPEPVEKAMSPEEFVAVAKAELTLAATQDPAARAATTENLRKAVSIARAVFVDKGDPSASIPVIERKAPTKEPLDVAGKSAQAKADEAPTPAPVAKAEQLEQPVVEEATGYPGDLNDLRRKRARGLRPVK